MKSTRSRDNIAEKQHSLPLRLSELQQSSAPIAASFIPGEFRPLIKDQHVQTIGGFFLRSACPYLPPDKLESAQRILSAVANKVRKAGNKKMSPFWDTRERIETLDGDWFHVDRKQIPSRDPSKTPTVLLIHGLESNSESEASIQMAKAFLEIGMNVECLNFRGCSGEPNDNLGAYHLGFTDDLRHYLDLFQERHAPSGRQPPLYLSGFSLGANVVLKCLGELQERAVTNYNIRGAAVWCPPLDQMRNARALAQPGINRIIYTNTLLQSLKQKAQEQLDRLYDGNPDHATGVAFDYQRAMAATTITEFDDAFIAPIYNFEDCWDYYQKTSSINYLNDIAVSTYLLGANDDPFMDSTVWPLQASREHGGVAPLKLHRTDYGGHLGYCFHQVDTADDPLLMMQKTSDVNNNPDDDDSAPPSWAPRELARFLEHVHDRIETKRRASILSFETK